MKFTTAFVLLFLVFSVLGNNCVTNCHNVNIIGIDCLEFCSGKSIDCTFLHPSEENEFNLSYCMLREIMEKLKQIVRPDLCCEKCPSKFEWGQKFCALNCKLCSIYPENK